MHHPTLSSHGKGNHGSMESLHQPMLNLHGNNENHLEMNHHHASSLLHEQKGLKINQVGTGYPIYNIPTRPPKLEEENLRIDQGMTEFIRPLPPGDGPNPYEVLTSASLGMDLPGVNQEYQQMETGGQQSVGPANQGVLGIDQPIKVVVSLKTKKKERPKKLIDIQDLLRKRTTVFGKNKTAVRSSKHHTRRNNHRSNHKHRHRSNHKHRHRSKHKHRHRSKRKTINHRRG